MMRNHVRFNTRFRTTSLLILLALLTVFPTTAFTYPQVDVADIAGQDSPSVASSEQLSSKQSMAAQFTLLGMEVFETGFRFADTEVGV